MWTLGSNNWISYGWGQDKSISHYPRGSLENFLTIDFSSHSNKDIINPIDAAIEAVNDIVDTYPAPYTLMCSGGADSQAMIIAWMKSGRPFNIVSVKYVSNGRCFNDYDLTTLRQFCKINNLNVTYEYFDIISFLENDLLNLSKKYDCDSPQYCTHIKMATLVESGTVIYSGNYINGSFGLGYAILGLHRYGQIENKSVIPSFFLHNPKLAYSFINNNLCLDSDEPEDVYLKAGFLIAKPIKKYNGFEEIKEYYDQFSDRVLAKNKFLYSAKPSKRVFDMLFRYPLQSYITKIGPPLKVISND